MVAVPTLMKDVWGRSVHVFAGQALTPRRFVKILGSDTTIRTVEGKVEGVHGFLEIVRLTMGCATRTILVIVATHAYATCFSNCL